MTRSPSLFEPTVQDHAPRRLEAERDRPWRLQSQGYVAFFGGPLAITAIAMISSSKLGLPRPERLKILAAGIAGFVIALALAATVLQGGLWRLAVSSGRSTR